MSLALCCESLLTCGNYSGAEHQLQIGTGQEDRIKRDRDRYLRSADNFSQDMPMRAGDRSCSCEAYLVTSKESDPLQLVIIDAHSSRRKNGPNAVSEPDSSALDVTEHAHSVSVLEKGTGLSGGEGYGFGGVP